MIEIVTDLHKKLKKELKAADEIFIGVALITYNGLDFILKNTNKKCQFNFLIGLDLPSDPKALRTLYLMYKKSQVNFKVYSESHYYHPKLYLIRKGDIYTSFVGSANCTFGGLYNNIELTSFSSDQNFGMELKEWFIKLYNLGIPVNRKFIKQYEYNYLRRKNGYKKDEATSKKEKEKLNYEIEIHHANKSRFINKLRKFKNSKDYNRIVKERHKVVRKLKKFLDYPKFQSIDIDGYFSEWELGHLISISKPVISRHVNSLQELLKYLTNEKIDISIRYERALSGELKLEGVAKAFVSKVLVLHKPNLYFVKNNKTEESLLKNGIQVPSGLSEGDEYKILSNYLSQLCRQTGIKDLSVLDHFLYNESVNI